MEITQNMVNMKNKCECCNIREATHIQEAEPYTQDIHNEIKLVNYCDYCWEQSVDDI